MKKVIVLWLAIVFCLGVSVLSAEPNVREGRWEITTRTEMVGMPMGMPPVKTFQCISKSNALPKGRQEGQCTTKEMRSSGDSIYYVILCTDRGTTAERKGQVTYRGDRLSDISTTTVREPGGETMIMKSTSDGRWVGLCR